MKLSIIVPAYNEEDSITEILQRLLRLPLDKEILVVDDGSTDATGRILEEWPETPFVLLRHDRNRGKGAAVHTALAQATGEVLVIQDADREYDPENIEALIRPILDGSAKVVYGSRVLGNPEFYSMGVRKFHTQGFYRNPVLTVCFYYGGRTVTRLTNLLFGGRLTDQPTCYKMFHREVLDRIHLSREGFEFCSEFTAKVLLAGYTIREVPISYHPRTVAQGKKLAWRDGVKAIVTLLSIRFSPRPTK